MSKKIRIVFLGTPDFSCPFLEKLANDKHFEILAVITQEDKLQGRKQILTPPPVKKIAQNLNLPIFQPKRLNKDEKLLKKLEKLKPDFLVVVAYGQILSQRVLSIPKIKPINIHGSILPLYRGASPIEQAILNGDTKTGLSIMEMEIEMDTGPVYTTINCRINKEDTALDMRHKLANLGAKKLPKILLNIKESKLEAIPQSTKNISYCSKINKIDGQINPFKMDAISIYNRWRAYFPWPGTIVNIKDKPVKLLKLRNLSNIDKIFPLQPGTFKTTKNQVFMGCNPGIIEILELQIPGKTAMTTESFLKGNSHFFI